MTNIIAHASGHFHIHAEAALSILGLTLLFAIIDTAIIRRRAFRAHRDEALEEYRHILGERE
jgi:hypothetical protein